MALEGGGRSTTFVDCCLERRRGGFGGASQATKGEGMVMLRALEKLVFRICFLLGLMMKVLKTLACCFCLLVCSDCLFASFSTSSIACSDC